MSPPRPLSHPIEALTRAARAQEADEPEGERDEPDLDARDEYGCTALHLALLHGEVACAKLLLDAGAEAAHGLEGQPCLHLALSHGCLAGGAAAAAAAAVRLLLEHEAAPAGLTDDAGRTPLHLAAQYGLEEALGVLLQASAQG